MIVVDFSVWIDFFHGVSTPAVERLDGLLVETSLAIGDLILVEVLQACRHGRDVAKARQLFQSLTLLLMLEGINAWVAAENDRQLRGKGITVRKTIDGIIATACNCCAEAFSYEANLPLLFSDRDFQPYVEHLGLQPALG